MLPSWLKLEILDSDQHRFQSLNHSFGPWTCQSSRNNMSREALGEYGKMEGSGTDQGAFRILGHQLAKQVREAVNSIGHVRKPQWC